MTAIEAGQWIEQLSVLKRFPRGVKAQQALAHQFSRHASDAAHAERIVDSILDECTEWPGPAVIREVAVRTSEVVNYQHNVAASQMEQWKREFERDVEPWLCPDCRDFGVVGVLDANGKVIRIDACGCPAADMRWYDPRSGRYCSEGTPGAALWNSKQQLDALNAGIVNGKVMIPGMVFRKPAREEKSPSTSSSAA